MFNLSLTACSFHLRKTNSRGYTKIFNLNMPLTLQKEKLIQNSAVVVCSYILGGCAGVAGSVLETLTSTMISFTIETYTDFFNYVAWLSLQYGYSGRYALRFSDYAGI